MGLNTDSLKIVEEMKKRAEKIGIDVKKLKKGTTILDCGVDYVGSVEAGRLFASVCLGGLGKVKISQADYGRIRLPTIHVETAKPRLACIGSQKAGWRIKVGNFFAMGSGPARMLLDNATSDFREKSKIGVLALECSKLPDEKVAEYVAEKCGIREEDLTLLAARTASVAGSTQVSARMVETALFKMEYLGIKINVIHASGTSPIAPLIGDDNRMMGVENDMIIYGSTVHIKVREDLEVKRIPSNSSGEYGGLFQDIFKAAGYDFYKIDTGIFAPAEVTVENIKTGKKERAGGVNTEMLLRTLEGV